MEGIVLAGGSGTRLFPLSRKLMPKQFIKLFENESLYQKTLKRMAKVCGSITVVTNNEQEFLAKNQAIEAGIEARFIIEPLAKSTFPAIAYAALSSEEEKFLATPSDHYVKDEEAWVKAVEEGARKAEKITVFGIMPSFAHTGFGYILPEGRAPSRVKAFTEKPSEEVAEELIGKGALWNSGMFLFSKHQLIEEVKKNFPEAKLDGTIEEFYSSVPEISFDHAVMEKVEEAEVFPLDCGWNDVGNFRSLYEILKNGEENAKMGDVISIDSKENLIIGKNTIATIGVENLAIVQDRDMLLVADKGSVERVKEIVALLKERGDERAEIPPTVYRPWGSYTVLEEGPMFKVKKIVVLPGKQISLQKHSKRAEHWVVVKGKARIQIGESIKELREDESAYVAIGVKHRIMNPYEEAVEIIEVQTGTYLGEDDIVRFTSYFGEGVEKDE